MDEVGFYLKYYNFSVRMHNGQWCMFRLGPKDVLATTTEQIIAVLEWADANRRKFYG